MKSIDTSQNMATMGLRQTDSGTNRCRTNGVSDKWGVGLMGCQTNGVSDKCDDPFLTTRAENGCRLGDKNL